MTATSLPFVTQDGDVWYLRPRGLRKSCLLPKPPERECAVASQSDFWPQESQRTADCNVPVWISMWLCWLFVLVKDGKIMKLLDAFVTDIHVGEKIWEFSSELALVKEFCKNSHYFSSHICIPAEWVFSIFLVNTRKTNSQRKCILVMAVYQDKYRFVLFKDNEIGFFPQKIYVGNDSDLFYQTYQMLWACLCSGILNEVPWEAVHFSKPCFSGSCHFWRLLWAWPPRQWHVLFGRVKNHTEL